MANMRRMKFFYLTMAVIFAFMMFNGCEREGENIPGFAPTVSSHMESGWDAFEQGNYDEAVEDFNAAKLRNANCQDAYLGLGWGYARIHEYTRSVSNFMLFLSLVEDVSDSADAYAGLTMTYFATPPDLTEADKIAERDSTAFEYARKTLSLNPDYVFSHDPRITAQALHVLIAQSYFNRKDYIKALKRINTEIDTLYIQSLIDSETITQVLTDTIEAVILGETPLTGLARLDISRQVISDGDTSVVEVKLVDVLSIKDDYLGVEYNVSSFQQGGAQVFFYGNPIPQEGDKFMVDYLYAEDYGVFLSVLLSKLQELQNP